MLTDIFPQQFLKSFCLTMLETFKTGLNKMDLTSGM